MAFTRLNCPECDTVLRPAKPVASGKKVKCPKCSTVFVAGDDDDEEDRPRKKTTAKKASKEDKSSTRKPATKEPPKKVDDKKKSPFADDDDEGTYGYIKEEEQPEEEKPKVDYLNMTKSTDLRGPAIVKIASPASKLQMVGLIGTIGWFALLLVLVILVVFPVKEEEKKPDDGRGPVAEEKEKKKKDDGIPFSTSVYGYNLGNNFIVVLAPIILAILYSATIVAGSIKMMTLESRLFGIIASSMLLLPIHVGGLAMFVIIFAQFAIGMIIDDREFIDLVTMGMSAILYLICIAVGVWCLVVLNDQEVKDGFEYDPE